LSSGLAESQSELDGHLIRIGRERIEVAQARLAATVCNWVYRCAQDAQ
jgi:hypothetical protein